MLNNGLENVSMLFFMLCCHCKLLEFENLYNPEFGYISKY